MAKLNKFRAVIDGLIIHIASIDFVNNSAWGMPDRPSTALHVDLDDLEQYIGLNDGDEKEIYENDIVRYHGSDYHIKFDYGEYYGDSLTAGVDNLYFDLIDPEEMDEVKIVGHISDLPDIQLDK